MANATLDNTPLAQLQGWKRYCQTRSVFCLVLGLGLLALAVRPVVDPDLWWHLRTGQLTLQNHAIFHTDPFSFTRAGQPWVNHEWLSDVLMFSMYRFGGWGGLIAFFAVVIAATYLLAFHRSARQPYLAGILTLWAAIASLPVWDVRPQILSMFFVSLLLLLHDKSVGRPRRLWWAVPLMLLWVNLHAGFASGIVLLMLFLLGEMLDLALGSAAKGKRSLLGTLAFVLMACLAVVPLNPFGVTMYWYPLATLRSASMQSHIAEWFSPNFHQPQYLPLALLMLTTIAALALSPRRVRPGELILLLAANFGALLSVRHIAIYALIAAPILSKLLDGMFNGRSRTHPLPSRLSAVINIVLLISVAAFVLLHIHNTAQRQPDVEARHFPVQAVSFLAQQHPRGPILNHYDWGGYLIWRLYPDYRVFIDGRADVYGDSLMKDFAAASSLTDDWRAVLEQWKIQTVLLPADSPLATALKTRSEWKQIYADPQAVVLTR